MDLAGAMFDTMIAAHVLDASRDTYRLDALASEFLGRRKIPIEDLIGRGRTQITMDAVPLDRITPYACRDADLSWQLADVLRPKLREEGLEDLFGHLEMPLMPVLAAMERTGVAVDAAALKKMETVLAAQAQKLRDRIIALAGEDFNLDSPRQLAEVLFEDLKLPTLKRTATGLSTDSGVLEQLAVLHELPAAGAGLPQVDQAHQHVPVRLGPVHPSPHRPRAHLLPPGRHGHRQAVQQRPQPPEHPHPHRPRPADPLGVRGPERLAAAVGGLLAGGAARAGAPVPGSDAGGGLPPRPGHPPDRRGGGVLRAARPGNRGAAAARPRRSTSASSTARRPSGWRRRSGSVARPRGSSSSATASGSPRSRSSSRPA